MDSSRTSDKRKPGNVYAQAKAKGATEQEACDAKEAEDKKRMKEAVQVARTSVDKRRQRNLKNPPIRMNKQGEEKPISRRRVKRAARGWLKAAIYKLKIREQENKRRKERQVSLFSI